MSRQPDHLDTPPRGDWRTRLRPFLAIAPLVFAGAFWVRAVGFVGIDPTLSSIAILFSAAAVAILLGSRIGAAVFVVVPLVLILSPSGTELAFSLAADDSEFWRRHAIVSALAAGAAAISAVALLLPATRRPAGWIVASVAAAAGVGVLGVLTAMQPTTYGDDLDAEARAALPVIDLVSYDYENLPTDLAPGETWTALVRNPDDLPHTFTVDQLGVDLYVPAHREAVVELTVADADLVVICTIGDHAELGMVTTIPVG